LGGGCDHGDDKKQSDTSQCACRRTFLSCLLKVRSPQDRG
jgi:hypothetical protein